MWHHLASQASAHRKDRVNFPKCFSLCYVTFLLFPASPEISPRMWTSMCTPRSTKFTLHEESILQAAAAAHRGQAPGLQRPSRTYFTQVGAPLSSFSGGLCHRKCALSPRSAQTFHCCLIGLSTSLIIFFFFFFGHVLQHAGS